MALVGYFDASGDASQSALAVAGFIGSTSQWSQFERAWRAVLDAEGVAELHMKEFAHSRGAFTAWKGDEARRASFLGRLADAMNAHTAKSVSVSLFMDHYNDFNRAFQLRERLGAPYAFASMFAVILAREWREQNRPGEPISFVFERGDQDQGDLLATLRRLKIDQSFPVRFAPKRTRRSGQVVHHYPFQACDFLAYESSKASRTLLGADAPTTGQMAAEIKARKSLQLVAPRDRDMTWRFVDAALLTEFCQRFRVPRRPS